MKATTDAVQLFGGYGYTQDFPVERFMRNAKTTQIYEGTNRIQRVVMARALFALAASRIVVRMMTLLSLLRLQYYFGSSTQADSPTP